MEVEAIKNKCTSLKREVINFVSLCFDDASQMFTQQVFFWKQLLVDTDLKIINNHMETTGMYIQGSHNT